MEFIEVKAPTLTDAAVLAAASLYGKGSSVYVLCPSEAEAVKIDGLLWTYDDQSFVPHSIWRGGESISDPVAVGWLEEQNPNGADVLLVAGERPFKEVLGTAGLFRCVVDLVPHGDEAAKKAARERFRSFRNEGYSPVFKPMDK